MLKSGSLQPLCTPSRLRPLTWVAALSLSGVTLAQDGACLPDARDPASPTTQAAPARSQTPANAEIQITSDDATVEVDGDAVLRGNVQVRQGDREIQADRVEYNAQSSAFRVEGTVQYKDPLVNLKGRDGDYSPTSGARFNEAEFELRDRSARGAAESIDLSPQGILRLNGVTFTTCPADDVAWQVRAGALTLNTGERIGSGRDARVDFKGVPILYLPWLSFPLGTARKSGFLFPSVGHSTRSGGQLAVPFYWNIAPNADMTFEPLFYTRRGLDLSGQARHMSASERTELNWNFLPSDDIADRDRSLVNLQHRYELPGELRFSIDAANASDPAYFEDFGQGPEGTSVAFLKRLAQLTYRDENWNIALQAEHFQTIFQQLSEFERPYARVPRLVADADFGWGQRHWLRYGFESEVVNFDRQEGVTGWRYDIAPRFALELEGPGYFFRPGAAWRYTGYSLDNALPHQRSLHRSLPIASVDAGLLFERSSGTGGKRTLTLEPRFLYLYVPFRDQNDLPIFDTALPDLNLVQLFRTNRYVGADRISDANQISVGVTSRLLETDSGRQYLEATLGQTYYFRTPRVQLPGEVLSNRDESDLIAELALTAYRDWNIGVGLQWDPSSGDAERSQVRLQYAPADDRVINLGYRFQEQRIEQAEVSGAWPIGRRWGAFARLVYSLRDDTALERFAGFEYRACCWRLRMVGRRFIRSSTGEQDTSFFLQLELNGLASVGSAADAFLEGAIRGYSRPDSRL